MPTGLTSYRSYDVAVTETVQVRVLGDRIVQLQPDVTPLLVMTTNAKRKKSTPTPRIERIEDDLRTVWDYCTAASTIDSVTTAVPVSTIGLFATNDLVAVLKPQTSSSAPEIMRVTALTGSTSGTLTVVRNMGSAGADSIYPTNALRIVGSAYAEGDSYGVFRSTQKVVKTSYCQIFRTPVQMTRTMQASRTYGESDYQYQKAKALMEHKKEIEGAMLWSRAGEILANPGTVWTTMGLRSRISTNTTNMATTGTLIEFNTFSETAFRYGSPAKLLIAAPVVISGINYYSQNKLLTEVGQTVFGVNIRRLTLPHGEFMLARNWLMEAGISGQAGFATEAYGVDLNNVEFCYLADQGETRDTQFREDVVRSGIDAEQDEWYTQAGAMFTLEKVHALLYNMSAYS